jgi:type II restriction/modification system DNA methylase subunit YeeA
MRIDELQGEIDEMAIQLKRKIDTMMPEQIRLHNEKVARKLIYSLLKMR